MQQLPCLHLCKTFIPKPGRVLGFHPPLKHSLSLSYNKPKPNSSLTITQSHSNEKPNPKGKTVVGGKGQRDNVWSVDNDTAKAKAKADNSKRRRRKGGRMVRGKKGKTGNTLMVSGSLLMEVDTVLQTQEPVVRPIWNTFASSVSGIWNGVGAVFSPITAQMEPIEVGSKNENLYDCYTLSSIEVVPSPSGGWTSSQIHRKINWVTFNPYGEAPQHVGGGNRSEQRDEDESTSLVANHAARGGSRNCILPDFGSFDFATSDVMEEDIMRNEPGLVFFEDGSYSRGPVDIPVGVVDDSQYYLSPTFKFEQCLVKGCHKRLRIVHTIEFSEGGLDIQIMRVAVYEEQWVSPANLHDMISDLEFDLKPFSQRRRTQPSELTGSWKVFEISATPIFGEEREMITDDSNSAPYVYLCTETLKKRSLPENPVYFGEEEMVDMQDVTVLWLPGGVTGYVDVGKDGILCIGVGWYSDEGINLVMERDYGVDGKLREVRYNTEVKGRWSDPIQA